MTGNVPAKIFFSLGKRVSNCHTRALCALRGACPVGNSRHTHSTAPLWYLCSDGDRAVKNRRRRHSGVSGAQIRCSNQPDDLSRASEQAAALRICERLASLSLSYSTLASFFSLSTSSSTVLTITPALRDAGSATDLVVRRGDTSTPILSIGRLSIFFLRACMIFCSAA